MHFPIIKETITKVKNEYFIFKLKDSGIQNKIKSVEGKVFNDFKNNIIIADSCDWHEKTHTQEIIHIILKCVQFEQ